MEIERRQFEMSRMVNMVEGKGWEETGRRVEGDKMSLSIRKNLKELPLPERRMVVDDLLMIVKVFGWEVESQALEEEYADASITKSVLSEAEEPE